MACRPLRDVSGLIPGPAFGLRTFNAFCVKDSQSNQWHTVVLCGKKLDYSTATE